MKGQAGRNFGRGTRSGGLSASHHFVSEDYGNCNWSGFNMEFELLITGWPKGNSEFCFPLASLIIEGWGVDCFVVLWYLSTQKQAQTTKKWNLLRFQHTCTQPDICESKFQVVSQGDSEFCSPYGVMSLYPWHVTHCPTVKKHICAER